MKLITTLKFFQQRMKSIFIKYFWIFALIYIDDIIVYFNFTQNHLRHLKVVFTALKWFEIFLSLFKCHFEYLLIVLLEHHISRLRIFTIENKIKVIKKLTFSNTLQQLKNDLSFCEYYKSFVLNYAAIVKLLKWLKTICLQSTTWKRQTRKNYVIKYKLWDKSLFNEMTQLIDNANKNLKMLKNCLMKTSTKAYLNFFRSFLLYIDESKKRDFEVTLHQMNANDVEHFIFFLSYWLTFARKNYWVIQLKCKALIWALHKLQTYFNKKFFIIITNHIALVLMLQSRLLMRCNTKLNFWALFLIFFTFQMIIWHWKNLNHDNVNALSRLFRLKKFEIVSDNKIK